MRTAGGVAVLGLVVASCNLTATGPGSDGREAPDASDRIRNLDLSPRAARPEATGASGSGNSPRAFSFFGSSPGASEPAAASGGAGGAAGGGEGAVASEGGFDLNFENASIATVAKVILGDILQTGYTIDPRAQGNISLSSGRPVPKARLLFVLEAALRSNNLALVRDAGGYMISPASEAMGSGGVDRGEGQAGYGVTVIPLRFVSAANVVKLLEGFSVKPGAIRSDPSGNMLIVSGSGLERRMALDTVANFDMDWMRGQSVGVYPVQHSTPEPLIAELEKILDSAEGGMGQGMVKFQAIGRMNAILVVAKKPDLLRQAQTWIGRLDGSQTAAVGVKVYRVRYGEAKNLSRLLNEIFLGAGGAAGLDSASSSIAPGSGTATLTPTERLTGGGQSLSPNAGGQNQTPFGMLRAQMTSAAGGAGGAGGPGGQGGDQASRASLPGAIGGAGGGLGGANAVMQGVRITPDVVNNSVLIYANQQNFKVIERALQQLDRPQGQVAIELTIAEVTLNDNLNYGVQFFLKSGNLGLGSDKGSIINSAGGAALSQAFPGFNFVLGSKAAPNLIINALHGYTDVKVLSNPSLVVVDNQPATLQVGDQVPVATGSATVLSSSNTVVNTVDYKNTGIILRVLPRITSSGNVMLEVEQEISNVPTSAQDTQTLTPTISERKVKSTISVISGQTVLLAGLISDKTTKGRNGLPVINQIPVIGDVFSQTTKSTTRTELIIFIRPQIIRDPVEASVIAEELRSKMRGSKMGSDYPAGAVVPPTPRLIH